MPLHRAYFHEIAQPPKIAPTLAKVLDGTDTAEFKKSHPVVQAARIQHGFMQAYPYTDGSGKVARLLANLYLIRGGFLPCVIHSIDRQRYYESLRGAETVLRELMLDSLGNALANGVKYVRGAMAARAASRLFSTRSGTISMPTSGRSAAGEALWAAASQAPWAAMRGSWMAWP